LESLWAILKGYWKAAGKCPNSCFQPIGEEAKFPSGYWQNRGNFYPFSLKHRISFEKMKELWKILKTLSGSSPIFSLSSQTSFSQTQTGATVPLKQLVDSWVSIVNSMLFRGTCCKKVSLCL
jgi:hypothetical protein